MGTTDTLTLREDLARKTTRKLWGLRVIHSPLQGARGVCVPLERAIVFGRDADADVCLNDAAVSRRHMTAVPSEGGVDIVDGESHNGTFVQGRRVARAHTTAGTIVRIGRTLLAVTDDARDPPASESEEMIGGLSLANARARIDRFAATEVPVIIVGETGTGKELTARALHRRSRRAGLLVAVNCAALPAALVESELFGHRRGSFTGAAGDHAGYFRAAHRGTLLLDEIVDLAPEAQAKLLRAVETREIQPVGGGEPARVDVRIVCAAADLRTAVDAGRFRRDLYQRLDGVTIFLPPLRSRREDIPLLVGHFLAELGDDTSVGHIVMERLCLGDWPGNIRQLKQVVRAAQVSAVDRGETEITIEDLPEDIRPPGEEPSDRGGEAPAGREEIANALAKNEGKVNGAAADLGITRARLYELIKEHAISPEAFRRRRP